jgi:hypothetical protein
VVIGVAGSGKSTVTLATELGQIRRARVRHPRRHHLGNCRRQLLRRTIRRSITGVELWNGNRERSLRDQLSRDPAKSILLWSWRTYKPTKREYAEAMNDPQYAQLTFVRLKSRRQTRKFLQSVR